MDETLPVFFRVQAVLGLRCVCDEAVILASAATPHGAAGSAEIAAVLADHRVVAAFAAQLANGGADTVAGVFWRFQDTHLLHRNAFFVEDAKHGIAVDDQTGDVGDCGRVSLLFARTGDESHEIAEGFRIIEQFPELHANPGRIENAHVKRQQFAEAVEGAWVIAGKPHRVGTVDAVRQRDFLQAKDEIFAGGRVEHIDGPGKCAVGARFGLLG